MFCEPLYIHTKSTLCFAISVLLFNFLLRLLEFRGMSSVGFIVNSVLNFVRGFCTVDGGEG